MKENLETQKQEEKYTKIDMLFNKSSGTNRIDMLFNKLSGTNNNGQENVKINFAEILGKNATVKQGTSGDKSPTQYYNMTFDKVGPIAKKSNGTAIYFYGELNDKTNDNKAKKQWHCFYTGKDGQIYYTTHIGLIKKHFGIKCSLDEDQEKRKVARNNIDVLCKTLSGIKNQEQDKVIELNFAKILGKTATVQQCQPGDKNSKQHDSITFNKVGQIEKKPDGTAVRFYGELNDKTNDDKTKKQWHCFYTGKEGQIYYTTDQALITTHFGGINEKVVKTCCSFNLTNGRSGCLPDVF